VRDKAKNGSFPSGFTELDRALAGGFQGSELIALVGKPGVGKLSLALNIAIHASESRYPI